MTTEYVIDGTNIITKTGEKPSLAPLLQLLLLLTERKDSFYCYFDADTRYKFVDDVDKQLYQNLIKFGLSEFFIQVSGLDADTHILKQATSIGLKVISNDTFEEYQEEYGISESSYWLLPVAITNGQFSIDGLGIETTANNDTIQLMTDLVNHLEGERNTLHGVIDKFKVERDFGFIRRTMTDKKLFFNRNDVVDKQLKFTVPGKDVSFKIAIEEARGIYYFCAKEVVARKRQSREVLVKDLESSNKILYEAKAQIQEQNAAIKATLDNKIETLKEKIESLTQENITLKEQVDIYKSTDNEVLKRLEEQKEELTSENVGLNDEIKMLNEVIQQKDKEIERLKEEIEHLKRERDESIIQKEEQKKETNELAFTVDFQQEKIENLDEDLKSTLRLIEVQDLEDTEQAEFEQLKKDYQVLHEALKKKNARIIFLTNNINDLENQLTLNAKEVSRTGGNVDNLLGRIQELERTNKELAEQVEKISHQTKSIENSRDGQAKSDEPTPTPTQKGALSRPSKPKRSPKPKPIKVIPEKELIDWWNGLEEQWKKAFNQGVLSRGEVLSIPTMEQLRSLFERKKIDIVGSGILLFGLSQLSFKLNNLSGLMDLKHLTELNLSGHEFTEMKGIAQLPNLELLNCTSNNISSLRNIKKLQNLKTLIIRDNELMNLDGIEDLEELEYINALYNQGLRSIAGVEELERLQVLCVPSFKTKIIRQLEKLKKINANIEVRNV